MNIFPFLFDLKSCSILWKCIPYILKCAFLWSVPRESALPCISRTYVYQTTFAVLFSPDTAYFKVVLCAGKIFVYCSSISALRDTRWTSWYCQENNINDFFTINPARFCIGTKPTCNQPLFLQWIDVSTTAANKPPSLLPACLLASSLTKYWSY